MSDEREEARRAQAQAVRQLAESESSLEGALRKAEQQRRKKENDHLRLVTACDQLVRSIEPGNDVLLREGLRETPERVAKAWEFWTSGYGTNPADVLKVFEDGAEGVDEMVAVRNMSFYSHCEHHLAPIFGTATIAYLPTGRIVGLSKLKRLLDVFARRLQVQERLTFQIADALMEHLQPAGVGVYIRARHMCMESRGVCTHGDTDTVTTALRGCFRTEPETRAEFLRMASPQG